MDNSNDPYADSTLAGVFLLPNNSLLASADTDPRVAAKSPEAFYGL